MLEVDVQQRLGDFELRAKFASDAPVVALFGRSGAGKSSVVNLLAGIDGQGLHIHRSLFVADAAEHEDKALVGRHFKFPFTIRAGFCCSGGGFYVNGHQFNGLVAEGIGDGAAERCSLLLGEKGSTYKYENQYSQAFFHRWIL